MILMIGNKKTGLWFVVSLFLVVFFSPFVLTGEVFNVPPEVQKESVGKYFEILEDTGDSVTLEELLRGKYDDGFRSVDSGKLSLGYTGYTYWLRLKTNSWSEAAFIWYLAFYGDIGEMIFYYPTDSGYEKMVNGWNIPNDQRPIISNYSAAFPIAQSSGGKTYYFKIKCTHTISMVPTALSPDVFNQEELTFISIGWLIFGIMFALSFYNTLIYVSVRERSYLYLGAFIFTYSLLLFSETGFLKRYLDIKNTAFSWILWLFVMLSLLLFTRSFLNTRKHMPRLDRVIVFSMYLIFPSFSLMVFIDQVLVTGLFMLLTLAALAVSVAAGIMALVKGIKEARCYMTASSIFMVGMILTMLDFLGLQPIVMFTEIFTSLGFIFMAFILSIGISNKISDMRNKHISTLEAMQTTERQLHSLFQNAGEGIFRFCHDMELITVNPAMARIFGYDSAAQLLELPNFLDHLAPETPGDLKRLMWEKGLVRDYQSRAYRKDGKVIYVSINAHAIMDANGNMLYIEGFMNDITEMKHTEKLLRIAKEELTKRVEERTAELSHINDNLVKEIHQRRQIAEALKKSEERYRLLIETMNEGFAIIDTNNMVTYANHRLKEMFGYTDADIEKHPMTEFLDAENLIIIKDQLARRAMGEKEPYEIVWRRKDGSPLYSIVSPQPIFGDAGQYMGSASVITDISALKKAEEELTLAKEAAEHANKIKSEFLANMSHEIRTPMNAVLGFTDLLAPLVTGDKAKSYIDAIKAGGKNLLMLINDILDLSKIEAGKLELQYEPVNTYTVFNDVKQVFSLKMDQKGLDFYIDIDDDIPGSLLLDEVRLRQILFNLVGNAVKFTGSGYVRISVRKVYTREDKSTLDLDISVEDTGIGIAPESLEQIFDAFRQQDGHNTKKYGGTGLGLAITRRLVEMLGGEITVTSEVGKGSTFKIVLHDVSVAATEAAADTVGDRFDYQAVHFDEALILVVDDIPTNRLLVREFLDQKRFTVMEAQNGREAVELARKHRPNLILMDIKMPVLDGYEAVKILKADEDLCAIPVIALTASAMRRDRERVLDSGFDGFLHKPVQVNQLFAELAQFLPHATDRSREFRVRPVVPPPAPVDIDAPPVIPAEARHALSNVVNSLENQWMSQWETVRKNGFFSDITEFGEKILQLGETASLPYLVAYGEALVEHANQFDIENMNGALNRFPKIIAALKTAAGHLTEPQLTGSELTGNDLTEETK